VLLKHKLHAFRAVQSDDYVGVGDGDDSERRKIGNDKSNWIVPGWIVDEINDDTPLSSALSVLTASSYFVRYEVLIALVFFVWEVTVSNIIKNIEK
jgi:hypothetical protein